MLNFCRSVTIDEQSPHISFTILILVYTLLLSGCQSLNTDASPEAPQGNADLSAIYPQLEGLAIDDFPLPKKTPYDGADNTDLQNMYARGCYEGIMEYVSSLDTGKKTKQPLDPAAAKQHTSAEIEAYIKGRDAGWAAAKKKVEAIMTEKSRSSPVLSKTKSGEIATSHTVPSQKKPICINIRQFSNVDEDSGGYGMEFSSDNKDICFWWHPFWSEEAKEAQMRVIALDDQSIKATGAVARAIWETDLLKNFPRLPLKVWRHDRSAGGAFWMFDKETGCGIRCETRPFRHYSEGFDEKLRMEFWRSRPSKERVWNVEIPRSGIGIEMVEFVGGRVLICGRNDRAIQVDTTNGQVVESFSYFPDETKDEIRAFGEKHGLDYSTARSIFRFSGGRTTFDPRRRWIFCGCSHDKRIRVVTLDQPHKIVHEINAGDMPVNRSRGYWHVGDLDCAGSDYLIVAYFLSGTLFGAGRLEIIDLRSWEVVWSTESDISEVCLSPDGKMMAFVRDFKTLEVRAFLPTEGKNGNNRQMK
jgi:hypothetical protein